MIKTLTKYINEYGDYVCTDGEKVWDMETLDRNDSRIRYAVEYETEGCGDEEFYADKDDAIWKAKDNVERAIKQEHWKIIDSSVYELPDNFWQTDPDTNFAPDVSENIWDMRDVDSYVVVYESTVDIYKKEIYDFAERFENLTEAIKFAEDDLDKLPEAVYRSEALVGEKDRVLILSQTYLQRVEETFEEIVWNSRPFTPYWDED